MEHFWSMTGNLHAVIQTSRRRSVSPPLCNNDITTGHFSSDPLFLHLSAGSSPHFPPCSFFLPRPPAPLCALLHSVAPSHLSSLNLPATNHNLLTTPRAHSTTLLAPIADLFIPDNAEGWRLWFETQFAGCISHGLTAWAQHSLGLIDVTRRRAEPLRAAFAKLSFCCCFF